MNEQEFREAHLVRPSTAPDPIATEAASAACVFCAGGNRALPVERHGVVSYVHYSTTGDEFICVASQIKLLEDRVDALVREASALREELAQVKAAKERLFNLAEDQRQEACRDLLGQRKLREQLAEAEARRHSLAQEITEGLRKRGHWAPATDSSDVIMTVFKALDTLREEQDASRKDRNRWVDKWGVQEAALMESQREVEGLKEEVREFKKYRSMFLDVDDRLIKVQQELREWEEGRISRPDGVEEMIALRAKLEECEEVLRLEARRKCADCNAGDRAGSGTSPARPGKSHPEEWWHDTGPYQSRCRAESIWDILTPSPTPTKEEQ